MRQLASDLRLHVPVQRAMADFWTRHRAAVLVGALLALFGWLTVQHFEATTYREQQCDDIRVIASIARDALTSQLHSNAQIIPRINFPGLSHAELVALVDKNVMRERAHVLALERVERIQCHIKSSI